MRRFVCSPSVISSSLENSGSAIAFHQTAISTIKVGIPTERAPSTMPGAIGFGSGADCRARGATQINPDGTPCFVSYLQAGLLQECDVIFACIDSLIGRGELETFARRY